MKSKTVLVVDDTRSVRRIISNFLKNMGFEILEAEHGEEALQQCRTNGLPHCIITDRHMPVMDGLTLIKRFHKEYPGSATKIILCTYIGDEIELKDALSSGSDGFIMKPVQKDIIEEQFSLLGLMR